MNVIDFINPFTPGVNYGDMWCSANFWVWMKSYGVTIQMKSLWQYFRRVLFVLGDLKKKMKFSISWIFILAATKGERVK